MPRRALVFQHMDFDTLGRFEDFLRADGFVIEGLMLHQGAAIPKLSGYDMLIALGGAMDVWEEEQYPWLVDEKEAIREWVVREGKPFLGICLGHQLLATALGGDVGMAVQPEVGLHTVALTEEGRKHPFFLGLPPLAHVLQWHHAEVTRLPEGAVSLAVSNSTSVQALAVGETALGLQFHAEWTSATIASWAGIPSYMTAMQAALGAGCYGRLKAAAAHMMASYHDASERIYTNLMASVGLRQAA